MGYEVDGGYLFAYDECGVPRLPANLAMDGDLYVLPNGKYLPEGCIGRMTAITSSTSRRSLAPLPICLPGSVSKVKGGRQNHQL